MPLIEDRHMMDLKLRAMRLNLAHSEDYRQQVASGSARTPRPFLLIAPLHASLEARALSHVHGEFAIIRHFT